MAKTRIKLAERLAAARRQVLEATMLDPRADEAEVAEAVRMLASTSTPKELHAEIMARGGSAMCRRVREALSKVEPPPGVPDYARNGVYYPGYLRKLDGTIVPDEPAE